jgi:hypothetical protein
LVGSSSSFGGSSGGSSLSSSTQSRQAPIGGNTYAESTDATGDENSLQAQLAVPARARRIVSAKRAAKGSSGTSAGTAAVKR